MLANQDAEQLLFPADLLFEDAAPVTANGSSAWWLLHTKSRQEKAVAKELQAHQLHYYLPLVSRRSLSRGRPREAMVPLFPSYVFLHGDEHSRVAALKTNRLAAVHRVVDGDDLRRDLAFIAKLIAIGAPLTPETRLEPGQRVRVKTGPCAGFEGTLVTRRGRGKLIVWVQRLFRGASIEIDDYCLEAI